MLSGDFFKLIISDQALKINIFLPKHVHFNRHKFGGVLEQLFFTSVLGGKPQKSTYLKRKKKDFGCSFNEIKVYVVTNRCTRHEKHQTIENVLSVDFLRILKKVLHFFRFLNTFENNQ